MASTTTSLIPVSTSTPPPVATDIQPLTTTFTAPPPCITHLTDTIILVREFDGTTGLPYFLGGGANPQGTVQSSCFPSSFFSTQHTYFSPGICPSGYTTGCVSTLTNTINTTTATETAAICCPTNWFCDTSTDTLIADLFYSQPWVAKYPCVYYPTGSVAVTSATNIHNTTAISVNDYGVSIRWQKTDFVSASTTSSIGGSTTSATSARASSTTPVEKKGLSVGAKAGIGAGVAVMVVMSIAIGALYLLLRRRKARTSEAEVEEPEKRGSGDGFHKPELDGGVASQLSELGDLKKEDAELDAPHGIREVGDYDSKEGHCVYEAVSPVSPTRSELGGCRPVVHEMEG